MDELPRRTFGGLLAAAAGAAVGTDAASRTDGASRRQRSPGGDGDVVTSTSELEAAFENLSPGDTVRIGGENAPYRTEEWLDVDVDGVTVVGPGVRRLIVPADGANVGGLRVGHGQACRDVVVRGVGFHGNPDGQSESADRLHGIAVRDARNVILRDNHVAATWPRRHGDGGSGISVGRTSADVQVLNNRVRRYGDRGVQVAGERIVVSGNVVTLGLDRPVACDLWYSSGRNYTAHNVTVYGNVLGESVQGSLVGVAQNEPHEQQAGYVSVHGNLGFGSHKHFCHVRGPRAIRNVSVQNNVSVHETDDLRTPKTKQFAGVAVDPKAVSTLSIKNNELYGYSGHGVHVTGDVADLAVQDNALASPGLAGVRITGASDGLVAGNYVTDTGAAGIRLERNARVAVRGNHVRRAGGVGIRVDGDGSGSGTDVASNYVAGNGREVDGRAPGILVRDTGVRVRGNAIRGAPGPAIAEADGAGGNLYDGNWAAGDSPWHIRSASSRVQNHSPPVDVHRGVSPDGGKTVAVSFDRPYERPPRLTFGRTGGGVEGRSFRRDGDGHVVGVELTLSAAGGAVDVFVAEP